MNIDMVEIMTSPHPTDNLIPAHLSEDVATCKPMAGTKTAITCEYCDNPSIV